MADAGTIRVNLAGNTQAFSSAINRAKKSLSSFRDQLLSVKGAIGAIGIQQLGSQFVALARTQVEAEARLEGAIRATNAQFDAGRIKQYASELQGLTTVGDEVTISAAAMLTNFKLTEDQIIGLLPRLQDVSVALGRDLAESTKFFGALINSGVGELQSYGIQLSDTEKETIKVGDASERAAIVIEALQRQYGGVAQQIAQTDFGRLDQSLNALADSGEEIGKVLVPALAAAAKFVQRLLKGFVRLTAVIAVAVEQGFGEAFELIKTVDFKELEQPLASSIEKAVSTGARRGLGAGLSGRTGGTGAPIVDVSQFDVGAAMASITGGGEANLRSMNRAFRSLSKEAQEAADIIEANARLRDAVEQKALMATGNTAEAIDAFAMTSLKEFAFSILEQTEAFQSLRNTLSKVIPTLASMVDVVVSPITNLIASFGGVSNSADDAADALRNLGGAEALTKEFEQVLNDIAEFGPQFMEQMMREGTLTGLDPTLQLGPTVEKFVDVLGDTLAQLSPEQIQRFRAAVEAEIANLNDIISAARLRGESEEVIAGFETELDNLTETLAQLGENVEVTSEQFKEMSEELTNVPTGVKVALARFRATEGIGSVAGMTSMPGLSRLDPEAAGININGDIFISSDNLQEFSEEMVREAQQIAVAQGGPLARRAAVSPGKSVAISMVGGGSKRTGK